MSTVRCPKSEIARLTHLSTQTTSLIVDRLIDDGLLAREARTRVQGRMGQPSVPISLRADGAFSIGVKVGRRSLDVLTMDFAGHVRAREVVEYAYPDPRTVFSLLAAKLDHMMAALGDDAAKVVGIGVAAPLWLGGWRNFFDTPPEVFAAWNEIDIRARVQALTALPVEFAKDTTAACAAELLMGQGRGLRDFLYVFIGTFIGGGLVIDGRLHAGPKGNAGAVGSFPLMSEACRSCLTWRPSMCWKSASPMPVFPPPRRTINARCRRNCGPCARPGSMPLVRPWPRRLRQQRRWSTSTGS